MAFRCSGGRLHTVQSALDVENRGKSASPPLVRTAMWVSVEYDSRGNDPFKTGTDFFASGIFKSLLAYKLPYLNRNKHFLALRGGLCVFKSGRTARNICGGWRISPGLE